MTTPRVVLNGLDLSTPAWGFDHRTLEGLGSPGSTISPRQRARAHGATAGRAHLQPRHVRLEGVMTAPTEAALWAQRDVLTAAVALDDHEMILHEQGRSRSLVVRREDEVLVRPVTDRAARWSVQVVALDPRLVGAPLTASTALPSTSGGLTVPIVVPFAVTAAQVSGQVSLVNPGTAPGAVRLRIDGPVSAPVVTHVGTGRSLVFASSLVLQAGEFVVVDMERHEVLAQGQASRTQWVTERGWSVFEPGPNTWAFSAGGPAPLAKLTVEAVPSWM